MHVVERHDNLHEEIDGLVLGKMLVLLRAGFDVVRQVAALAVVHHHAQLVLVHKVLVIAHDAGMVKATEHLDLLLRLFCAAETSGRTHKLP